MQNTFRKNFFRNQKQYKSYNIKFDNNERNNFLSDCTRNSNIKSHFATCTVLKKYAELSKRTGLMEN